MSTRGNPCLTAGSDMARLACFDRAPAPAATVSTARADMSAPAAWAPPPTAAPARAQAPRYRLEVGAGVGMGHYDGSIGKPSERVDVDSFIAARGTELRAAFWDDKLLGQRWGMGIDYNHFVVNAKVDALLGGGIGTMTDPVRADLEAKIRADMVYVSVGYRPRPDDTIRPYMGGGIGAGRAVLSTQYTLTGFVQDDALTRQSSPVAGLQGFGGVEFDVTDNFYIGPAFRVQYFTGRPLGFSHQFINANIELNAGYRF